MCLNADTLARLSTTKKVTSPKTEMSWAGKGKGTAECRDLSPRTSLYLHNRATCRHQSWHLPQPLHQHEGETEHPQHNHLATQSPWLRIVITALPFNRKHWCGQSSVGTMLLPTVQRAKLGAQLLFPLQLVEATSVSGRVMTR